MGKVSGISEARKRLGERRGEGRWKARGAIAGLLALALGACAPLTTLPDPPGSGKAAPEFPAPFDGFDSARPPAYRRPPEASPTPPPAREEADKEEDDFGGIFRPGPGWPPWARNKKARED